VSTSTRRRTVPRLHKVRDRFSALFTLLLLVLLATAGAHAQSSIQLRQHSGVDAGITTTASLGFPAPNTAGNWVAVVVRSGMSSSQVFTVRDSNGNTYRQAAQIGFKTTAVTLAIYYAENINGGADTVTVSDTVSGPLRFAILEYSGVAASTSLDIAATATATSAVPDIGTVTTTADGDLLLGAVATTNAGTFTAGSGHTIEDFIPAEPNTKLITEDQVQQAAGAASASSSLTASDTWGAILAAFKPGAGGGTAGPQITGINPSSGTVRTSVTITGNNFGATQGSNTVTFNGTAASPTSWSATSIVVPVPSGATTGNVVVTTGGGASNGVTFTVTAPPSITSLSPTSGPAGTSIIITGTNFGSTQGTSTVTFNGTTTTPTTWSATSIVASVPTGATTGNVVVTVTGLASNGVPFTVATVTSNITLVQTASLDAGKTTTASLGFKSNNTAGNWVAVVMRGGMSSSQVFTVSDSSGNAYRQAAQIGHKASAVTLAIYYAENIKGGANTVTVSDTVSSPLRFAILEYAGVAASASLDIVATATGTSAVPDSGTVTTTANGDLLLGAVATTNGGTFTAGSGHTIEDFIPAEPNTKLTAEDQIQQVAGAASANSTLAASDSWDAILAAFKPGAGGGTPAPQITGINPTSGAVGTSVTITGSNFGATQGSSTVSFNGTAASPKNWSATSIVAPVPSGATTGNVVVTVGGVASNGVTFTMAGPTPGQLSSSTSTLAFGNVNVGSSSTQSATITNTGGSNVSISNVSIAGPGFSANGISVGQTLNPGASATLNATFAPAASGSATGSVTITSNASNSPLTIALSGTGVTPTYSATLNWNANTPAVAGYNVYRSTVSGGPYTRINSSLNTNLTYTDKSVVSGQTYYYVLTAVDSSNRESGYSNQGTAVIP